jgi:hypothetical protein
VREARPVSDPYSTRTVEVESGELSLSEVGQECNRNDLRLSGSIHCGLEHWLSAGRVNGDQICAQRSNGGNSPGDRIWNVVELEIEKERRRMPPRLVDSRRSESIETLEPDLQSSDSGPEETTPAIELVSIGSVERYRHAFEIRSC